MILAIHRQQPNWPANPARPIFQIGQFWVETDGPQPTQQQVDAVLGALPRHVSLSVLQDRIEAEGAWDAYVTYMFGAAARRNAFLKIIMRGGPVSLDNAGLRTSLEGAGLTADQVNRILA